ncbi:leucine-rich repeat-containing protein 46 [Leptodactylus fuscus]
MTLAMTPVTKDCWDSLSQALLHLRTVRLDREGITTLKNLEMVKEVQSLYLQENQIKNIENVDVLKNLRFLNLSWNKVEKIQNLWCLTNLQVLDLSHNLIKKLDTSEIPQSLLILDLTGNPCTKAKDYRQQLLDALPFLQDLDGEPVRDSANRNSLSENEEEEDRNSSDDSDETSLPFDVSGGLSFVCQEMIERSYQRRHRALREHEERLSEINNTPDKQPLIPLTSDTANIVPQEIPSVSLQQETTCATKPQNSIISEKRQQSSALVNKQRKDQKNNDTMPASKPVTKNEGSSSSRSSGSARSSIGLNRTTAKRLTPSAPQSKVDNAPAERNTKVTTAQKDRQAISAPPTRKMNAVPTKTTLQAPEKTPTRHCSTTASSTPQNERQAASAPTKKTLQSPEKLLMTRLKVSCNVQGLRKKTP